MDINQLIAIVKKKLINQIQLENIETMERKKILVREKNKNIITI